MTVADPGSRPASDPRTLLMPTGAGNQRPTVRKSFQLRAWDWLLTCFGLKAEDRLERSDRLLEEVLELLQANGYPQARADAISRYVYLRPAGRPNQELGGVMLTIAGYAGAHGLDMDQAGEMELARVWTKIDKIRAKQALKPVGASLPL